MSFSTPVRMDDGCYSQELKKFIFQPCCLTIRAETIALCEKIVPLKPRCKNIGMDSTPRKWAYGIESCVMDVFQSMIARQGTEDPTDLEYEEQINEELEKANWKERVDFSTPKEFQAQRWDETLNSHTFIYEVVSKMGLKWPKEIPVLPKYKGWLLDTMIAAPGRRATIDDFVNRPVLMSYSI